MKSLKALAAAGALALMAGGASAATTSTCPDTGGFDRYFELTTEDPISNSCYAWGDNNDSNDAAFNAQRLAEFGPDHSLLGKAENGSTSGSYGNLLTGLVALLGGTGGSFSIDLTGLTDVLLVFKTGTGQCGKGSTNPCDPGFAAFLITPAGPTEGAWSVNLTQGLSHVSLYGNIAPIPVPATGLLLVGALGGLAALRRRRKTV